MTLRSLAGIALVAVLCSVQVARSAAGPQSGGVAGPPRRSDVLVDVQSRGGAAPAQLAPGDISATLGSEPAPVRDVVVIAPGDWTVLVYADALAARPGEVARAAEALASVSPRLAELGAVTLVVADTLLDTWVDASRDADELRESFDELAALFSSPPPGARAVDSARRRELLLEELGRRPHGKGARLLLLLGDPIGERTAGAGGTVAAAESADARAAAAVQVAALGWVALPLGGNGSAAPAISPLAEESGGEVVADAAALASWLGRLESRRLVSIELPPPAVGGGAAPAESRGAILPLSLSGGTRWTVRGPRWLAAETPDFALIARVSALVTDDDSGDLDVTAVATLDADAAGEPNLAVEVLTETHGDVAPAGRDLTSARFRATFILARLEEPPVVIHHRGAGTTIGADGGWLLQARLDAPEELQEVAVVIEDVATGSYGAALVDLESDQDLEGGDLAVEVADLRAVRHATTAESGGPAEEPPLVRLVPPRSRELRGLQTFRAMSLNAFIKRVVFFLDGRQVAEDRDDPFVARLDLGSDGRQREIRAVAFDRAGRQLGEDAVTVNRPRATFDVDIIEVTEGAATGSGGGPIGVAAEVSTPPGRRVERLELYWNETLATTLTAPPWTAKLDVRPTAGGDYVRAVAHLDDGSSLEDVHLVGAAGLGEEVEVNLVEIFAVVLDQEGAPVRDLERSEVEVRLAGKRVELERFGVAEDLPLDVGLVIDTSQSMEVLMDDTRQAAVRFLADLIRPGDRAFLVDFDTKPRLAQAMTREMTDLVRGLGSLRAGGNTALYDSILFSILHFEEGEDRRAIVLLTDGDDYQSRFSARQAALQARSAGVPVYMLSLAGMDWLRPALRKADLETIAKQTGGHVFYVSAREELAAAYARIGAELRSQYVLAFATPRALSEAELAKLDVEVDRPGATVRAVVAGRSIQTR